MMLCRQIQFLKACEDLCSLNGERTPLAGTTPPKRQARMRALPRFAFLILVLSDDAKKAVCFVCDSSGEINSVAQKEKIPQAIKLEWRSIEAH